LITAIISGVIIFFSCTVPRRILTNQIFSELLKEYRSDRMGVAVKKLWEFFEHTCNGDLDRIETFTETIVNEYKRIYHEEIESGNNKTLQDIQNTLHFHRRIVSQYYQQLARLCFYGQIRLTKRRIRKSLAVSEFKIIGILFPIEVIAIPQLLNRTEPSQKIIDSQKYLYKLYIKSKSWNETWKNKGYISTDKLIAEIIKSQIDIVFSNKIFVFVSSVLGVIRPGSDWLTDIKENLKKAIAVIVLITPISINRPWIWFEIGAFWSKISDKKSRIYPVCVPEIELSKLPEPLNRLNAISLGDIEQINVFFKTLCEQIGFGDLKNFNASVIQSNIPNYNELRVDEADILSGALYTGPYQGYTDEELKEVIDEEYLRKEYIRYLEMPTVDIHTDKILFTGRLIHFKELDEKLKLPHGTSKELLKEVSARYGLKIVGEWENSIRFVSSDLDRKPKSLRINPYL